jgi:hypothetical protein
MAIRRMAKMIKIPIAARQPKKFVIDIVNLGVKNPEVLSKHGSCHECVCHLS